MGIEAAAQPGTGRHTHAGKSAETIRKYMDAAEDLFIRLGYEATSIRAISAQARMNLGTVVYHWGTKEALFRDVCLRRFEAINREQVRRLTLCNEGYDALTQADLPEVLRALVEPPLLMPEDEQVGERTRHLYGRVLTDPSPVAMRVTLEIFGPATDLFNTLVRRCLRQLEENTFYWRYVCAVGSFVIAQSFEQKFTHALELPETKTDWAFVAEEIVRSMEAGLVRK